MYLMFASLDVICTTDYLNRHGRFVPIYKEKSLDLNLPNAYVPMEPTNIEIIDGISQGSLLVRCAIIGKSLGIPLVDRDRSEGAIY